MRTREVFALRTHLRQCLRYRHKKNQATTLENASPTLALVSCRTAGDIRWKSGVAQHVDESTLNCFPQSLRRVFDNDHHTTIRPGRDSSRRSANAPTSASNMRFLSLTLHSASLIGSPNRFSTSLLARSLVPCIIPVRLTLRSRSYGRARTTAPRTYVNIVSANWLFAWPG